MTKEERALDRACELIYTWSEAIREGEPPDPLGFGSPDTIKHYLMDDEFFERFERLWAAKV